jgi:hypothetical protein
MLRRREPVQRTCLDAVDELKRLAKLRVAGSNPVFRSRETVPYLGRCEIARWLSSLFLPITAHQLPITGQGWSDGSSKRIVSSAGTDSFELSVYGRTDPGWGSAAG